VHFLIKNEQFWKKNKILFFAYKHIHVHLLPQVASVLGKKIYKTFIVAYKHTRVHLLPQVARGSGKKKYKKFIFRVFTHTCAFTATSGNALVQKNYNKQFKLYFFKCSNIFLNFEQKTHFAKKIVKKFKNTKKLFYINIKMMN